MAFLAGGCALILVVLLIGAANRLSLYSPLFISGGIWLVVFGSGLAFGGGFFPLTERAFIMWTIWFLTSGAIYFFLSTRRSNGPLPEVRALPYDYTFFLVVLNAWLAYKVWAVGNGGPSQFFFNLRLSSNQVGNYESLGLVGRFYPLIYALFLFEIVNSRPANRRLRVLLWCWMMLFAFGSMGKLSLLTPVLAWAVIRGLRGFLPIRKLVGVGAALFGVMVLTQLARTIAGESIRLEMFLSLYTYSPIVALGYMKDAVNAPFGAHVFRFLYAVQHDILGGVEPVRVIQDYVAIPHLTNVYTVMQPFALDFGLMGIVFGATVYGFFFGILYFRAVGNRQLATVVYAGLSVILAGQFIGEFLFTMFSGHLQFIIAACWVTYQSRKVDGGS